MTSIKDKIKQAQITELSFASEAVNNIGYGLSQFTRGIAKLIVFIFAISISGLTELWRKKTNGRKKVRDKTIA